MPEHFAILGYKCMMHPVQPRNQQGLSETSEQRRSPMLQFIITDFIIAIQRLIRSWLTVLHRLMT